MRLLNCLVGYRRYRNPFWSSNSRGGWDYRLLVEDEHGSEVNETVIQVGTSSLHTKCQSAHICLIQVNVMSPRRSVGQNCLRE